MKLIDLVGQSPEYLARYHRMKYHLPHEDYAAMEVAQHGDCALCGHMPRPVVDHNHDTNQVRQLLCDHIILREAASYIERHQQCESQPS